MPIIGPNPGRGRGPLEPQLYYAPAPVGQTPDTTKIFRGHLRSLPDQPYPPNAFQSWTYNHVIKTAFTPPPGIQPGEPLYDLAPSQRPPEQIQLHSWTWNYNLNLIGKDRLPTGVQPGESVQALPQAPLLPQFWAQHYNPNIYTITPVGPFGVVPAQFDWPNPQTYRQPQFWTQPYNPNLYQPVVAGPLGVVANQYNWPPPQAPTPIQQSTTFFNINYYPPTAVVADNTKIFRGHLRSRLLSQIRRSRRGKERNITLRPSSN